MTEFHCSRYHVIVLNATTSCFLFIFSLCSDIMFGTKSFSYGKRSYKTRKHLSVYDSLLFSIPLLTTLKPFKRNP